MTISPYGAGVEREGHPAVERGKVALITDLTRCPGLSLDEQVAIARDGGAHLVMVRAPELEMSDYQQRARKLASDFSGDGLLVIYDLADLAAEVGAGVQLGKDDEPVASVRQRHPHLVIGYSAHSLTEAVQAGRDGASFVLLSLIFPTSKDGYMREPLEEHVWSNSYEVGVPVFALGGITLKTLPQAMEWGVRRVAVSSGVLNEENPAEALALFMEKLSPKSGKKKRLKT